MRWGVNHRMTEFVAAVLLCQLKRIPEHVEIREQNAAMLTRALSDVSGIEPIRRLPEANRVSWHVYGARYLPEAFEGVPREVFLKAMRAEGVPLGTGYAAPVYKNPVFQQDWTEGDYRPFVWTENAQDYRTLHLPRAEQYCKERIAAFCEMAAARDVFVQFRIKHTRQAYLIGNYLDLGPCGVEVPQTETMETANEAVESFYYPPLGKRSNGGRFRRGFAAGGDWEEYLAWWNTYGVLWLQVESVEAVTSGHLLARPGVDALSFGPTDLALSLKAHPNHWLKTVDDCVAYLCRSLAGSGVAVCHRTPDPKLREKYADMGVQVLLESPKV